MAFKVSSKINATLVGIGFLISTAISMAGATFPSTPYTVGDAKMLVQQLGIAAAILWFVGSILATTTYYMNNVWARALSYFGAILNAAGALATAAAVVIGARA